ncbi:MAG TPA: phosphoribosylformylglycinamidine cyclo-ligase [Ignavibacteria bacterium]|nr:phosphoribosylformylglycinamidine cyclo-ligase [Ignavibacteria bacterium]
MNQSYKKSGVNISEAEKFVEKIKPFVKKTFTSNVLSGIGNFGAFYKINLSKYKDPVFVSSVDGVGTKLKIASELKKFDTIGEDLVNHCVNDIAVCGAVPMYFLDYYATGKLKSSEAAEVIKGITRGCINNNCSLIGGETAEMPGVYFGNDFDLAGSITGIAEQSKIVNSKNVKKGDILIGLPSNGLHTNGFSLVRKIFDTKKKLDKKYTEFNDTLGNELLKVHLSYLKIIQASLNNSDKFKINSISHITGSGIIGNTKRVVPSNLKINIDWNSWERPFLYSLIQKSGNVSESDMRRTFNLGIGLIFIIPAKDAEVFSKFLKNRKQKHFIIGNIY